MVERPVPCPSSFLKHLPVWSVLSCESLGIFGRKHTCIEAPLSVSSFARQLAFKDDFQRLLQGVSRPGEADVTYRGGFIRMQVGRDEHLVSLVVLGTFLEETLVLVRSV